MRVGTERFFLGGGRGREYVLVTPDNFYLVRAQDLLDSINQASGLQGDFSTLKVTRDAHKELCEQLASKNSSKADAIHAISELWIELIDGERILIIA
jgi:hypothetical protein